MTHNSNKSKINIKIYKKVLVLIIWFILVISIIPSFYCAKGDVVYGYLTVKSPPSSYEGYPLQIIVSNASMRPVESANIVIESIDEDIIPVVGETDENGIFNCIAPSVQIDSSFLIKVQKEGYENTTKSIIIRANTLNITSPPEVDEGETFQVSVKDSLNNPVKDATIYCPLFPNYPFLTDGEGIASLITPSVDRDTTFNLYAEKEDYTSAFTIITVKDVDESSPPSEKEISITVDSTVTEGDQFIITLSSEGILLENALVEFNDQTKYTDDEGKVLFTAPEVNSDQDYRIDISKDGYKSSTVWITIKNKEIITEDGYIFGLVSGDSDEIIKSASICMIKSDEESDVQTSICSHSDNQGEFGFYVPHGRYNIEITKNGYQKTTLKDVIINKLETVEVKITLNKIDNYLSEPITESELDEQLIQVAINSIKEDDNLCGEVSIINSIKKIDIYKNNFNIDIESSTDEELTVKIAADAQDSPAVLAIHLDNFMLSDISNIKISLDNESIEMGSFEDIVNLQNSESKYGILITKNDEGQQVIHILVSINHFSEHTLTIKSVVNQVVQYPEIAILAGITVIITAIYFVYRKGKEDE